MQLIYWSLGIVAAIAAIVLLIAWICYRMAFYAHRRPPKETDGYNLPEGEIYEPYREKMIHWIQEVRQMPRQDVSIRSFDGLTLRGYFYEYAPGAPIELMFHGYRGDSERDLCGGVQRSFKLGHSVLLVDQRACGRSDGHVITFGVYEHRDCLSWLEFMQQRFADTKIILTGISMGAATVMMAASEALPDNVVGVLADCGYTSAREIIYKVIAQDMKLPPKLAYPFVKLGARVFGGFRLESHSPVEAMAKCRVPVIFFHGDNDAFVPCDMSIRNHAACIAPKALHITPGAGHGLCYPSAPQDYLQALRDFFDPLVS